MKYLEANGLLSQLSRAELGVCQSTATVLPDMINALTWSFGLSAFFHTLFHALNSQMRHRFASIFSVELMQPPTSTGYPKLFSDVRPG